MTARTILVTGANRGIGYSILQALATATPTDHYILAARSQPAIDEAIASLRATPRVKDASIEGLVLDVTNDDSIERAVETVRARKSSVNVLVNNAGIAQLPPPTPAATRAAFAAVLDANVAGVANVTLAFLPLLLASSPSSASAEGAATGTKRPLVINISSGRASLTRSTTGALPPTASISYSVSKVALNGLTIELAKSHPNIAFCCANPGHCKTAFNGFRGARDPLEGAEVVVELVREHFAGGSEGIGDVGFRETIGKGGKLERVPW